MIFCYLGSFPAGQVLGCESRSTVIVKAVVNFNVKKIWSSYVASSSEGRVVECRSRSIVMVRTVVKFKA